MNIFVGLSEVLLAIAVCAKHNVLGLLMATVDA